MTLWLSKKGYRIGWVSSIFLHHRNVGVGCCNKCCHCPTHIFQHCPHARSFCPVPELNSLPEDLSTHTEAGHKYGNYPRPMMKGNWLMNSPVSSPLMIEVEGNLQIWSWNKSLSVTWEPMELGTLKFQHRLCSRNPSRRFGRVPQFEDHFPTLSFRDSQ